MSERTDEKAALTAALNVILARVRCEIVHNQTSGGRCANCISWAENIGTPEHLPRLLLAAERIAANASDPRLRPTTTGDPA